MDLGPSKNRVLRPATSEAGCLMEGSGLPLKAPGASGHGATPFFWEMTPQVQVRGVVVPILGDDNQVIIAFCWVMTTPFLPE